MFDPYKKWLGISPKDQPPHHYRLLSLELYETDLDVIEGAADRVMGFLRQYQSGDNAADAAKLLNEVASARICLLKPASKAAYDEKLRKQLAATKSKALATRVPEEASFRAVDLEAAELPSRRKRTSMGKSTNSKPSWIPIGIGAGLVIILAAFSFGPRASRDERKATNNTGTTNPADVTQPATDPSSKVEVTLSTAKAEAAPAPPVRTVRPVTKSPVLVIPSSIEPDFPTHKDGRGGITDLDPSVTISVFLVEKLASNPFKYCYGPSLVETPSDLVAVFQAGDEKRATDKGIWITRSLPENKWTPAVQIANADSAQSAERISESRHCSNPVLFRYPDGRMLLFYRVSSDAKIWRGMLMKSSDEGKTWSKPQQLPEEFVGPTKNKPQILPDGSLLCGSSTEDHGWQVHFEIMNPDGIWSRSAPINNGTTVQGIEPALLFHQNNRWQSIGRSTKKQGRIFNVWSDDGAQTWGEMKSLDLPNPGSSLDAITLKDGRIVLVYNHSSDERTPLNVAISTDGKNWKAVLSIEVDGNESTYPSVIQAANGIVHIAYCSSRRHIRHYAFDPQKVRLQSIVDGKWPTH